MSSWEERLKKRNERKTRRSPYEFSAKTILDALRATNWSCERCGIKKEDTSEGFLEVHHKLPIWVVTSYYPTMSIHIIKDIANAEVLCCDCHDQLHENTDIYTFMAIANELQARQNTKTQQAERAKAILGAGSRRRI